MNTGSTLTQTNWPKAMLLLEPGISVCERAASIPEDKLLQIEGDDSSACESEWSDVWSGWGSNGKTVDVAFKIEQLTGESAQIESVFNSDFAGVYSDSLKANFENNELHGKMSNGSTIDMRMRHSDAIEYIWRAGNKKWMAGVLSRTDIKSTRSTIRIPVLAGPAECGKEVSEVNKETLEAIVFKPSGPGPYPTVIVSHGACGSGTDASAFKLPWTSPPQAKYFTERGYMVVFPQRRGRGRSDGLYLEGLEQDGTGYSVRISTALQGFNRAMQDMHSVVEWANSHPEVCSDQIILSGQSRGGLLSLVYANENPNSISGVINFVGGWIGDSAPSATIVNDALFDRAAGLETPTLWLYSDSDSYYRIDARLDQFNRFIDSGGNGSLSILKQVNSQDGHYIVFQPTLWKSVVNDYLKNIEFKTH